MVPFQAIAKAMICGEYEGFAKVIGHTRDRATPSASTSSAPQATDLIAEASLAFTLEATAVEIGGATHAHPTLARSSAKLPWPSTAGQSTSEREEARGGPAR